MKAVFVDCTPELKHVIQEMRLEMPSWLQVNEGNPSDQELKDLCADADLIFVEHTVIKAEVLAACGRLRGIVFMGTGAGTYVPLAETKRLGIEVVNTPGYANRAVAEHTLALLFSAARQVARMDREVRAGVWSPRGGLQLQGRKIAVLGLGGIGEEFASMAQALGMRVYGWNYTPRELPYFVSDLNSALEGAHVVSLHLALNADTEGLINAARLNLLAPGAILVNTARAQLVEDEALRQALKHGRLGHAALDVFASEPLSSGHEWTGFENVTLTSHAAYMTNEAYAELWRRTLDEARKLQGQLEPVG
jgi:D-3-phosphoglycerate dehydrogenase